MGNVRQLRAARRHRLIMVNTCIAWLVVMVVASALLTSRNFDWTGLALQLVLWSMAFMLLDVLLHLRRVARRVTATRIEPYQVLQSFLAAAGHGGRDAD